MEKNGDLFNQVQPYFQKQQEKHHFMNNKVDLFSRQVFDLEQSRKNAIESQIQQRIDERNEQLKQKEQFWINDLQSKQLYCHDYNS